MIIKCLTENTSFKDEFECEHGLSLYIETKKHKILFDLGQTDLFYRNMKRFGLKIEDIDTVIISHGHNDHGGGLSFFLSKNKVAKIYINSHAFETHLSIHEGISKNIGLDPSLIKNNQICLVDGDLIIDDELYIFNKLNTSELIAKSNNNLFMNENGKIINDDFKHEQNLLIKEDNTTLLIAGCAHRGIVNIVRRANEILKSNVNYCIGGFHLSSPRRKTHESLEMIDSVASELLKSNTIFYTCHCTGLEVYKIMKEKMKANLEYISAGKILNL